MKQITDMKQRSRILIVLLAITALAVGGPALAADGVTKVFTLDPSTHGNPESPSTRAAAHSSSAPPATAQSTGGPSGQSHRH